MLHEFHLPNNRHTSHVRLRFYFSRPRFVVYLLECVLWSPNFHFVGCIERFVVMLWSSWTDFYLIKKFIVFNYWKAFGTKRTKSHKKRLSSDSLNVAVDRTSRKIQIDRLVSSDWMRSEQKNYANTAEMEWMKSKMAYSCDYICVVMLDKLDFSIALWMNQHSVNHIALVNIGKFYFRSENIFHLMIHQSPWKGVEIILKLFSIRVTRTEQPIAAFKERIRLKLYFDSCHLDSLAFTIEENTVLKRLPAIIFNFTWRKVKNTFNLFPNKSLTIVLFVEGRGCSWPIKV